MKIKKDLIVLGVVALICLIAGAGRSYADGGIFIPHNFSGYETGQKAFIYFNGQSETLVVSANFRANAKDFSWVIPTPAKPEIDKASLTLFSNLEKMTKTDSGAIDTLSTGLTGSAPKSSSVEVIEQKKVDIYDTAILKATDEAALANWLNEHGYNFPADKNSELKSYVEDGWYFAIAKIQNDYVDQVKTDIALTNGTLTPLKLTFASDKIIYPMKLTGIALRAASPGTAVSATPTTTSTTSNGKQVPEIVSLDMPIKLYVLTNHKTQNSTLATDWANWASEDDVAQLKSDLGAGNISNASKQFLTVMSATIPAAKIADDLTITNADNDQAYPAPQNRTIAFWAIELVALILTPIGLALFPPGLIFVLFVILQRFAIKRKWVYVVGLIYEVVVCLAIALVSGGILLALTDSSAIIEESGLLGLAVGVLISLAAAIFFTVKMFARYRRNY